MMNMREIISLIEGELFESLTASQMVAKFGGRAVPFSRLPVAAKKAIRTRAAEYEDFGTKIKIPPDKLFGYVEIPIDELKKAVFDHVKKEGGKFNNFEEYHDWYTIIV